MSIFRKPDEAPEVAAVPETRVEGDEVVLPQPPKEERKKLPKTKWF